MRFEALELRCVLSADWGFAAASESWLTLQPEQYEPHSILVKFREEASCESHHCLADLGHGILPGSVPGRSSRFVDGLSTVRLESHIAVADALAVYNNHPAVLFAEPNYRVQLEAIPNDANYADLWGLNNEGQTGGSIDADIDAQEAWDLTTGSGQTIVAVIDTGVDYTHPDLQANMWVNQAEWAGEPGVDDDGNGYVDDIHGYDFVNLDGDPMDDHDHGTHVAGTIGASGDNGLGVVGVNWDIQIMALKFLGADGGGDLGAALAAIDYAVANGASISNNSWGYNGTFSPSLYQAIREAGEAGHTFVAAAGNGNAFGVGQDNDVAPFYPAAFDLESIVSVAALDHEDQLASFSNFGAESVDLGAPGVNILSTTIGNGYESFNGTSMATPHVAGTIALVQDANPSWSRDQVIASIMETVDPVSDLAGASITGGRVNAYQALNFSGPEIQVLHDNRIVRDETGHVHFGRTLPGVPSEKVFTIKNVGLDPLILNPALNLPNGFVVVESFGATTVAPGQSTSFTLALSSAQLGSTNGEVSFATNDSNEGTFNFSIAGEVSNVLNMDDGDDGFSTVGSWTPWSNQGFNNDMTFTAAGSGVDVATWEFDVLPGQYEVAATWSTDPNRATDAPFTMFDGTNVLATRRVNQELAPLDFSDFGVGWQSLGAYTISNNKLRIQLSDEANEFVIADGIRIERVGGLPPGPEIELRHRGGIIEDDAGVVDLGKVLIDDHAVEEFFVRNVGSEPLLLGAITVPTGFSLLSSPAVSSLQPGEVAQFEVGIDSSELKLRQGVFSIASNDEDESDLGFVLSAQVVATRIADDGEPEFTTTGDWASWTEGFSGDMHYSTAGSGADTARWTFAVAPGDYAVAATWTTLANRATNAPYTLYDGSTPLSTVVVNQELTPGDFVEQGVSWRNLDQVTITSGTLTVVLSDNANEYVIADAVRIQRLDLPPAPEIELSVGGVEIEDELGVVDFGTTVVSGTVRQLFTVTNRGDLELALAEPISTDGGFVVTSSFGDTTLAPGESTTFEVSLTADAAGSFNGSLSFASNDNDESLYNVGLQASASDFMVIDNGDVGFSVQGNWTNYSFFGYQSDFHYSNGGVGADQATWSFQVAPGQYALATTWHADSNRATNSPFAIFDDASLLANVPINQEVPPGDFSADGANWASLGSYLVTGDTLTVRLTDAANEFVIADAVRLERLGDLPSTPEIVVQWGSQSLVDGVSTVDFGSTQYGLPRVESFTVKNVGGGNLDLASQLSIPAGFSLHSPLTATSLGPGESASFSIQLDGSELGVSSGSLALNSNDSDEDPFDIALTGSVATVQVIDNGAAGFSTAGEWTHWQLEGFSGDMHYSTAGSGADTARWTFAVAPGDYAVAATWTTLANRATNAPYTLYDGSTPLSTVVVNQELTPGDFVEQGVSWRNLDQVTITSGTLTVVLSDNANEYVIADAVRIQRLVSVQGTAFSPESGTSAIAARPMISQVTVPARAGMVGFPATASIDVGTSRWIPVELEQQIAWEARRGPTPALKGQQSLAQIRSSRSELTRLRQATSEQPSDSEASTERELAIDLALLDWSGE